MLSEVDHAYLAGMYPDCRTADIIRDGGWVIQWDFPNGYGASIACHDGTYGQEPELLVTRGGTGCYDTPITRDVLPYLTLVEAVETLIKVRGLPITEEGE